MLRSFRIRRAHRQFLASCRSLSAAKEYWKGRGLLAWLSPIPTLAMDEGGGRILEALRRLEASAPEERLGADAIRGYHRMVMGEDGGKYRTAHITVEGSSLPGCAPHRIPAEMQRLDVRLTALQEELDREPAPGPEKVLIAAVDVHQRIGLIHPFTDANGRVARLAMNHLLRRYGAGYVIYPPLSEESPLWDALQEAHAGRPEGLVRFAKTCLHVV